MWTEYKNFDIWTKFLTYFFQAPFIYIFQDPINRLVYLHEQLNIEALNVYDLLIPVDVFSLYSSNTGFLLPPCLFIYSDFFSLFSKISCFTSPNNQKSLSSQRFLSADAQYAMVTPNTCAWKIAISFTFADNSRKILLSSWRGFMPMVVYNVMHLRMNELFNSFWQNRTFLLTVNVWW